MNNYKFINNIFSTPHNKKFIQSNFSIIEAIENSKGNEIIMYKLRNFAIKRYGFAIPSIELIEEIKKSKKVLEVGAGSGYLSKILEHYIDIKATDSYTKKYRFMHGKYNNVQNMSAVKAINKYPDRDVLMSWPCYNSSWAYNAAKAMKSKKILYYIGEGYGGCTADDTFHKYLSKNFIEKNKIMMPNWDSIYDCLFVLQKK